MLHIFDYVGCPFAWKNPILELPSAARLDTGGFKVLFDKFTNEKLS